jgi:ribulose 1,5-bisphosphate carboxylase large subunit-like protein
MKKEPKGVVSLVMDDEVVRTKYFNSRQKRKETIEQWTKMVQRIKSNKKHFFISIIYKN